MMFTGERAIAKPDQPWEPTPKQRQAIALLATGETVARTAKLVRVAERTVWYWRTIPEFRAAVREVLSSALDEALAVLTQSAPKAARLIDRSNEEQGTVDRDRLAIAQWTIDRFRHLTDGLGMGSADDSQSRVTVSQSVSVAGPNADIAHLTELLLGDRDAKRSLLVEPFDVAPTDPTEDPPPDAGLRPV